MILILPINDTPYDRAKASRFLTKTLINSIFIYAKR
jgi:hypothetical protein